jgi:hypothetical protein
MDGGAKESSRAGEESAAQASSASTEESVAP